MTARPNWSAKFTASVGQILGRTWIATILSQPLPEVRAAVM